MPHSAAPAAKAMPQAWTDSPFLPENEAGYRRWRERKLRDYPSDADALKVAVADAYHPSAAERAALLDRCRRANIAVYVTNPDAPAEKGLVHALGRSLGLERLDANMLADEDAVTSVEVAEHKSGRGYIPYSNKRLLWHTDGYYNPPARRIRAFILHCMRPAARGGENTLLDHEIAYLRLRDADPAYIRALMAADAMTIPANTEPGEETRGEQSGPVFSIDESGKLHMRYTARTRSIVWKNDAATREGVACLTELLAHERDYLVRLRLAAGEGLVCNNVLHNRSAFEDELDKGPGRLLYRARYYDRVG